MTEQKSIEVLLPEETLAYAGLAVSRRFVPHNAVVSSVYYLKDGRTLIQLSSGEGLLLSTGHSYWVSIAERSDEIDKLKNGESVQRPQLAVGQGTESSASSGLVSPSSHILSRMFFGSQDFPGKIPGLLKSLAGFFSLDDKVLDKSLRSLEIIDALLYPFKPQSLINNEGVFAALTAYIGEVIINATRGSWLMRYDSEYDIWEPWVATRDGHEHAPFLIVYKELYESSVWTDEPCTCSLRSAVELELQLSS